ncbi:L-serine ammonia-lyase [Aestuariirhabdus litorea]|uniref:L-serine dehydratase n=1 Tax=Aestuariirhabdus litorea TaxID=2528527 RepID=A0A3P3VVJ5_9GAMM|nr:L-serine ammonia-lyase [Aestuariirhabdus litorea]RRJ84763.1 L-serine ammonia-lyase [Aestuariirhabdus litorea]RWW97987.1 L-serine ammonia-lyase [Endozoicomonadaceae bacterium GTF-13]
MQLSIFDLFKVGIGPSSSHTVGPMWAMCRFLQRLALHPLQGKVDGLQVHLYGSLSLTGKGHATDRAVILGLSGCRPDRLLPEEAEAICQQVALRRELVLDGRLVSFDPEQDIHFHSESLARHPNGLRVEAYSCGSLVVHREYFSVGGGFVVEEGEEQAVALDASGASPPYPFTTAAQLLELCQQHSISISELMLANEVSIQGDAQLVFQMLDHIWQVMEQSIEQGCRSEGVLPGGLGIRRRARRLCEDLKSKPEAALRDPLTVMDWVSLYALAVNEENAAGGRVVTAPTNGAAGVIPAVLAYYMRFMHGANQEGARSFLATAAAIGMLYKHNASISAAEVGCQGEIGVACSMAAGALTAVMGGSCEQIENAAEIGMEHNLGMTCDPIGGLVQVPCIERNTMGAIKAINAARLALRGDGKHRVSLDSVIETMHQTGIDMQSKYKETSQGGLAVNVVEC